MHLAWMPCSHIVIPESHLGLKGLRAGAGCLHGVHQDLDSSWSLILTTSWPPSSWGATSPTCSYTYLLINDVHTVDCPHFFVKASSMWKPSLQHGWLNSARDLESCLLNLAPTAKLDRLSKDSFSSNCSTLTRLLGIRSFDYCRHYCLGTHSSHPRQSCRLASMKFLRESLPFLACLPPLDYRKVLEMLQYDKYSWQIAMHFLKLNVGFYMCLVLFVYPPRHRFLL